MSIDLRLADGRDGADAADGVAQQTTESQFVRGGTHVDAYDPPRQPRRPRNDDVKPIIRRGRKTGSDGPGLDGPISNFGLGYQPHRRLPRPEEADEVDYRGSWQKLRREAFESSIRAYAPIASRAASLPDAR
jgi:hypothetical protein